MSLRIEVGDFRGRGQIFVLAGNRSGCQAWGGKPADYWARIGDSFKYKCAAGPNRWFAQFAVPFKGLGRTPLRGEAWGVKLVRYGKATETGALRLRSSWPYIPAPSENTVLYNGRLFFDTDNVMANGGLAVSEGEITSFEVAAGKPEIAGENWSAPEEVTLVQKLQLQAGGRFCVEWSNPADWSGTAAVCGADVKLLAEKPLSDRFRRLDFELPAGSSAAVVRLKLKGTGDRPVFRMSFVLDDVPLDWICLTNNDWIPERNLKNRLPQAAEGAYTYLKSPLYNFGHSFYRTMGCIGPKAKAISQNEGPGVEYIGLPVREPLDRPLSRPDIGEDEFENFPFQFIWQDPSCPDMVGLPNGSFDKGGVTGWIPFSNGSLTGDDSWTGWPTDRWNGAVPHDLVLDFKDNYYLRRLDILQPESGFRTFDVLVRSSDNPAQLFVPIYRPNGPGTSQPYPWYPLPAFYSIGGLDSVARQMRLFMGTIRPDSYTDTWGCKMFGVAEIWVWAEPRGKHPDTDVTVFEVVVPNQKPKLECAQLQKLPEPVVWPRPKELKRATGRFIAKPNTTIVFADAGCLPGFAAQMQGELQRRFCLDLPLKHEDEAAADENVIRIGMKSHSARFDRLCGQLGVEVPAEAQGYALQVSPQRIVLAGADIEGTLNGMQTLLQWADHDEENLFFRAATFRDWPLLKLRTVIPTPDHRNCILPLKNPEWNYYALMDGLRRYRFNGLVDWQPAAVYRSDAKTRELLDYAAARLIEFRPALFLETVPGECIEDNPDDQPEIGRIGPVDGYWDGCNLCPSNPATYRVLDAFLDEVLKTRTNTRFIEIGYMGALQGRWNVCRLCQKRALSDGALYGDFLNRLAALCGQHGKTAVFTNAVAFANAPDSLTGKDLSEAANVLNRALVLRVDRPMEKSRLKEAGFWTLSRPWDTPRPVRGPGQYEGGKAFFDTVPSDTLAEGAIITGDNCDYASAWAFAFCGILPVTAETFWNGPEPGAGTRERAEYDQALANACVRLNEDLYLGHEYPSWRTGLEPRFFKVDIRALCVRSHVDEGTAQGIGHSGAREGMLGNGPGLDLRRVPTGAQMFSGVPFDVIDPAQNDTKSMIVIGDAIKEQRIPGALRRVEIPIGRKAASLCVLRAPIRKEFVAGHWKPQLIVPAYIFVYADGSRYVCDRELGRWTGQVDAQCFRDGHGNVLGHSVASFLYPSTRVAYFTNTLCGDGATLFLNEFTNPYPEKEIRSLVLQLPNPEQRHSTIGTHEAVFAVTGVEPTAWDIKVCRKHSESEYPLLPPEPVLPPQAEPLLQGRIPADWEGECRGKDGPRFARLSLPPKAPCPTYQVDFDQALSLAGLELRLRMPDWYNIRPVWLGCNHADVKIRITENGKDWQQTEVRQGCTGMDGPHVFLLPGRKIKGLQIAMDGAAYEKEEPNGLALIALEIFSSGRKSE